MPAAGWAEVGLSKKLLQNELTHFRLTYYLSQRRAGARISGPPVFIVGCGHSGTTMLRHVLNLHPNIYAVPYESRMFFHSSFKIRLADAVWSTTAVSLGKSRWVEKTPAHIHRLQRILQVYPDSRILLLIRDGRDVAISLRKRWGDFERSLQRWIDDNRAGEPYWDHPQVMRLGYEQLVADFERQIRSVCDFIGEPFNDNLLKFSEKMENEPSDVREGVLEGAQPRELRDRQIGRGLYSDGQKWISQMTDSEKSRFKEMAGEMLIRYGYANNMDW